MSHQVERKIKLSKYWASPGAFRVPKKKGPLLPSHLRRCTPWDGSFASLSLELLSLSESDPDSAFRSTVAARIIPGVFCPFTIMVWRFRVTKRNKKYKWPKDFFFRMTTRKHSKLTLHFYLKCLLFVNLFKFYDSKTSL